MEYLSPITSIVTIIVFLFGAFKIYVRLDKENALSNAKDEQQDKEISELKADFKEFKKQKTRSEADIYKKMDEHYQNLSTEIGNLRNAIMEFLNKK